MITRSPLGVLLFLSSLVFVIWAEQSQYRADRPTVQECQAHIDAALEAFLQENEPAIDDNDATQVHSTETNDLDEEDDDDEIQHLPSSSDPTHDDDDDDDDEENDVKKTAEHEDDDDDEEEHPEEAAPPVEDSDDEDTENENKLNLNEDDDEELPETSSAPEINDETDDDDDDDDDHADKKREISLEKESASTAEDENDEHEGDDDKDDDEEDEKHGHEEEDEKHDHEEEDEKHDHEAVDESGDEETEENEEAKAEGELAVEAETEDAEQEADDDEEDVQKSTETEIEEAEGDSEDKEAQEQEEAGEVELEESVGEVNETTAEDDEEETEEDEEVLVAGPGQLRSREHIEGILRIGEEEIDLNSEREKIGGDVLKELKKLYEGAVKPLEQLYQFKDISNRLLGDAEIFSKPMVVFMGPWSTGKSAIVNYLLGTEYTRSALKTGAEPTSNSFNVILYGDHEQVIDGTQLAADWAFSSLQKFGQGFLDRLKGRKMNSPILRKMTIVDTPGIIENRKTGERLYPFNDAFQWFIDRADLIYIVFDPTKLEMGLEMEALFDQLKGRENQIRILLNKADIVKPQELMKVQGNILWNLSPMVSTANAPTIFVGSFWSKPYLPGSPDTLFQAQEEAFLEDIYEALETQVENKVALARRHAVRVRNHAKMVDCYLNTYYNHKTFFSNKRKVAEDIVDNPQNYHIYEGMSTMVNVSRYDLPDPDIYREFFSVHPLFDFKPLASTCSYFKGCPLDKLDITIAYDLPELVGKYHRVLSNRPPIGGR